MTHGIAWSPGRRRNAWCGIVFSFAVAVLVSHLLAPDCTCDDTGTAPPIRISFSSSMFSDVNENDAKAAVKAWSQVLFKEHGIPVEPEISVLSDIKQISRALRGRLIDAIAFTTDEYWALESEMQSSHIVLGQFDGHITEEYLVLVHRESGIERLGDLRGRSIAFFTNQRMSLAAAWLDTLLTREGLGVTSAFCGRVTRSNKLARVILPVFFRQSDACVVTRRGFQTMSELNPQVGRQLKAIASSPELVPAGFFFRGDYSHSIRDKAFTALGKIHTTPAGQQALTVFQSGKLEVHPISVLNSAFELLNSHRRLCGAANGGKAVEGELMPGEQKAGVR